jgi:hypothetical protein
MTCKTANVCGNRRKLCFGRNGKIKSNTAVGGSHRRRGPARKAARKGSHAKGWGFAKKFHCTKHHAGYRWAKGGRCLRVGPKSAARR